MTPRQRQISQLSRDKSFIIRAAIGIGTLFFASAFLIHFFAPDRQLDLQQLEDSAPATARDFAAVIRTIGSDAPPLSLDPAPSTTAVPGRPLLGSLEAGELAPEAIDLLTRFHTAVTGTPDGIAGHRTHFESVHSENPQQPLAAGFAAYLYALQGDAAQALPLYIAEGAFPDASFERTAAITIAANLRDRATLDRVLALPRFRDDIPGHPVDDQVAIITRDFAGLMSNQFAHWLHILHPGHFAVSLINGAVWFIIIFGTLALKKRHLPVSLLAVAAGVFSTAVTLSLLSLQSFYTEVGRTGSFFDDAVYWIAGVGLREEFAKLLCFAVLIPILRPYNSGALAFACASFVGLGFAVEENNQYFNSSFSSAATARFLTANFLHLSTTGIAGYYLYKLSFGFRGRWEPALGAFLFVVFLHGIYDLLLSMTAFSINKEIGFLYIAVIGVLAFNHAKMIGQLRLRSRPPLVSPLATFVLGMTVILGLSFVVFVSAASTLPDLGGMFADLGDLTFGKIVSAFGQSAISSIMVAFLFINQFRSA